MVSPEEIYRAIVSSERRSVPARVARGVLGMISRPYGWVVNGRNHLYDRKPELAARVDVPVVSVGNLTLGGTGKTPMVAWLGQWFAERDLQVCLVSRGYKDTTGNGNDEAKELAARLPGMPHLQDRDRVATAKKAITQNGAQLILMDDGFQHRRLARDLDIVLVDATQPFGYGHLFPRGMLREPIRSLSRATVIALTRANHVTEPRRKEIELQIRHFAPKAIWVEIEQAPTRLLSLDGTRHDLDELNGKPVLAFCGIGNPVAFQKTLTDCNYDVVDMKIYPDHFSYPSSTINDLSRWSDQFPQAVAVICTHKDSVKLRPGEFSRLPIYAVLIEFQITVGLKALETELAKLVVQSAQ